MSISVLENYGQPLTYEMQTAAADTALTIFDATWKIIIKRVAYTSGGTSEPVVGGLLVGATSSATAIILEVPDPTSGTWAGGDAAGWLYVHNRNGTAFSSENLNYVAPSTNAATANIATIAADTVASDKEKITNSYGTFIHGAQAKAALITVETQDARIMTDGTAPTPSTHANGLTDRGLPLTSGSDWLIRDINQIKNIRTCNKTASSNHSRRIICYF